MSLAEPVRRLAHVLAAIEQQLPNGATWRVGGPDELARLDGPNRIVAEPLAGRLAGAPGGSRALYLMIDTVRFHVWGESMDHVEELTEVLLNAINAATGPRKSGVDGSLQWSLSNAAGEQGAVRSLDMSFETLVMRRETKAALTFEDPITTAIVATI